jgi:hypothetical protein
MILLFGDSFSPRLLAKILRNRTQESFNNSVKSLMFIISPLQLEEYLLLPNSDFDFKDSIIY